jgi:exodeoxyribonuclease-3
MKIYSYNVNGIRAALKKGLDGWIAQVQPDVICFQELKAEESQIGVEVFEQMGYCHKWFPAQKKGYSGVGMISKIAPDFVEFGIGNPQFDDEGRLLRADFGDITLLSVYFPSGTTGGPRQEFKMQFLDAFLPYLKNLKQTRKKIIVSGDYNICHKPIDINHPERHLTTSGFLPEERAWMDLLVNEGFIDSFREFDQRDKQYSWWSYRAGSKSKNLGWRIDYHFVTNELQAQLRGAGIIPEPDFSDHCPVWVEIE